MKSILLMLFLIPGLFNRSAFSQWQTISSGTTKTFVKGCFVNDSTGYVISSDGLVLKTADLGNSWSQCASLQGMFTSVFNVGTDTVYAGGSCLYRSADKGATWSLITVFGDTIADLGFFDSKYGFALFPYFYTCTFGYSTVVFDDFSVYKTSDYGSHWELAFGQKDRTSRFQFLDRNTAYITGYVSGT